MTTRIRKIALTAVTLVVPSVVALFVFVQGVAAPWVHLDETKFRALVLVALASVLAYQVLERRVLDELLRRDVGVVRGPWSEPEAVHVAAAQALRSAEPGAPDDRVVLISTLPAHAAEKRGVMRLGKEHTGRKSLALLQERLKVRIVSEPVWHVRHLINITTPEELVSLERWLAEVNDEARAYEVRCVSTHESMPVAAPLVIANEEAFLGIEDPARCELTSAIQMSGRAAAAWVTRYFEDLWEQAPFTVRTRNGIDRTGLASLRAAVSDREQGSVA